MAAVFCSNHPRIGAVGKCSRCEKFFCLDCLDIDTGRPLCSKCLTGALATATQAPLEFTPPSSLPVTPKEDDTHISLDDLNIGIMNPAANRAEVKSKPTALPAFKPATNDPLGLFKESAVSAPSVPEVSSKVAANPLADLPLGNIEKPKPLESTLKSSWSPAPDLVDKRGHVPNFDLAGMMKKLDDSEQKVSPTPSLEMKAPLEAQDKVSARDLHAPKNRFHLLRSLIGVLWLRFEFLASKFRIPAYLLAAIIFAVLVGGITYGLDQTATPAVQLVDSVPPIHLVSTDASQVSDMDITAFSDIQNHLGSLGFTQVLQMTVPQLPSPNFFDVGFKPDERTYSEILKMPNQIGPRVSFVTIFTNGVWYSTNGWVGTNQQLDYLVSEFYPDKTPEQLYRQHAAGVQKLQTANGWEIQKVSVNRYMAALSDHLRWFVTFKKILPYQAEFASWH